MAPFSALLSRLALPLVDEEAQTNHDDDGESNAHKEKDGDFQDCD